MIFDPAAFMHVYTHNVSRGGKTRKKKRSQAERLESKLGDEIGNKKTQTHTQTDRVSKIWLGTHDVLTLLVNDAYLFSFFYSFFSSQPATYSSLDRSRRFLVKYV